MSNVVSITVQARDMTRDTFSSVDRAARNIADNVGRSFSRIGDGFRNAGEGGRNLFSRLGDGLKKTWEMAGGVGEKLSAMGQKVGEFADTPQAKLALLTAALSALPFIASTAAVAITVGLGTAIAGIGIMAAAQNDKVKKAFSDLKEDVTDDLQEMAEPFVPVLIRISDMFKSTFDNLSPALTRAFEKMAPVVEGFAEDLTKGIEKFGPTIDVLAQRFGPLMDVLGSELQVLLEHLATDFMVLAEAADPEFVSLLMSSLTALIDVIVYTIAALAKLGSGITNLVDLIPGINFDDGEASARSFGESILGTTENLLGAGEATGGLTSKVVELANQFLAASDSEIAFEAAIDSATKAVAKNGRTLDINTEKGRDNRQALNSIASSALRMRDDMEKAGQDSSQAMSRARRQFINAAVSMGMSRSEARKLADQSGLLAQEIRRVPSQKRTRFSSNANSVRGDVQNLAFSLGQIARNIVIDIAANYSGPRKATGGPIGAAATGGARGNLVMVGEQGRELVRLPYGSQVIPNGQTESMMAGGSGGGSAPFVVQLRLGTVDLGEVLIDPIRKAVQTRGGNVQATLGR